MSLYLLAVAVPVFVFELEVGSGYASVLVGYCVSAAVLEGEGVPEMVVLEEE